MLAAVPTFASLRKARTAFLAECFHPGLFLHPSPLERPPHILSFPKLTFSTKLMLYFISMAW